MSFFSNLWNDFVVQNFPLRFKFLYNLDAPTAAQMWYRYGGDKALHAFWLFAAPVHMQLGQASYFLTEPAPILVSKVESESIIAALKQHFTALGYHFYVLNDIWFLGVDTQPLIKTTPIKQVINKEVSPFLPSGTDALKWASLQNEIQMLLHSHPVNEAREKQGLPAINSLWFYGLGSSLAA